MPTTSTKSPSEISSNQWQSLLGEALPDTQVRWLNSRLQIIEVQPGQSFWHSQQSDPGLYILLAGKIRLFDESGAKLTILVPGDSFGVDRLFPDPQLPIHIAKGALTRDGGIAIVAGIAAANITKLWQEFPKIQTYLNQHRQFSNVNQLALAPVAPAPASASVADWTLPAPAKPTKVKPYFPSPSRRLGQWWQRRTNNYPFYAQQSTADCGAACLVMIGRYWGKSFRINRVREMVVISRDGSSLKTLSAAAENLGFNSRPIKASLDQLAKQPLPAIAHWRGNHYIVVYAITPKHVIVSNPAIGQLQLTHAEFQKDWTGYCLLVEPTVALSNNSTDQDGGRFWQLLELVRPHKVVIGEVFVASIVLQIFGLVSPIFTQLILDRAVVHKSMDSLTTFAVGLLMMGGFQIAMGSLRQYLIYVTAIRIDTAMLVGFIRHAFSLPLPYFDTRQVGDIISRMQENQKIRSFITGETIGLILDILSVFVYVTLMFVYSWKLACLVLVSIPPFLILNLLATPFFKKISREVFNASASENSYLIEALNGIRTVKSMAVERSVRWHWEELLNHEVKQEYRHKMFGLKIQSTSSIIDSVSHVALLWLGASLVISGEFSIGQLFAFNMLSENVINPFKRLSTAWNQFQEVTIAIERICDVIDSPPEEDPKNNDKHQAGRLQGRIVFDKVTFRYNIHVETNTLENLSFAIQPGQTVAIVGRSGSGKTTLAKMILGLYPATSGKILLDGRDINTIDLHSLRTQIGVVDQSNFLFSGSIGENIALGYPQASRAEIRQAAHLAGADEFIQDLPMTYDTQIGEGGGMLSGGQRQRLAIARALLGNPRLLIFDEATSSLDTESERIIQNNLDKICRDRTTILIAHRLSTVRNADLILVLDKGILIESGNHRELMAKGGQYFYLNEQQQNTIQQ